MVNPKLAHTMNQDIIPNLFICQTNPILEIGLRRRMMFCIFCCVFYFSILGDTTLIFFLSSWWAFSPRLALSIGSGAEGFRSNRPLIRISVTCWLGWYLGISAWCFGCAWFDADTVILLLVFFQLRVWGHPRQSKQPLCMRIIMKENLSDGE